MKMNNKYDDLFNKMADMIRNPDGYKIIQKLTMIGSIEIIRDRLALSDNPTILDLHISPQEHNKYFICQVSPRCTISKAIS